MAREDITPGAQPDLDWTGEKCTHSLKELRAYLSDEVQKAIKWYFEARRWKRNTALMLRVSAIIFTAAAGILPVIVQMWTVDGKPLIQAGWSGVAVAVAAVMILIDKVFGFSSGWMRYISTGFKLKQLLQSFEMDWEIQKARCQSEPPSPEHVQLFLGSAKGFITEVNRIVIDESADWMQEFRAGLGQLEESAKAKPIPSELGSVTVEVSNGDQCPSGWDIQIDDGSSMHRSGKSAAFRDLVPGERKIVVTGMIGGVEKRAEGMVTVPKSATVTKSMTLS